MRRNYTQPALLLRQLWLLAAFAGIFAARYFCPALVCLLLLLLHQHRRVLSLGARKATLFILGLFLFFALGLLYTTWRTDPAPPLPVWAEEAASFSEHNLALERELAAREFPPQNVWDIADNRRYDYSKGTRKADATRAYREGLRLRARVLEAEGRVDRNLRLILTEIQPLEGSAPVWAGQLAFTWYEALTPEGRRPLPLGTPSYLLKNAKSDDGVELLSARPVPGQELELTLRLRPVRGLKNFALWDIEPYWGDRGVSLRAWEHGEKPAVQFAGGAGFFFAAFKLRESLRQAVLSALPLAEAPPRTPQSDSAAKAITTAPPASGSGADIYSAPASGPIYELASESASVSTAALVAKHKPRAGEFADHKRGAPMLANGAELIPALLFADKYLLDSRDAELFARSTLAHSLALSGLHLGYAAALGYFAVGLLYRLRPGLAELLPRRKAAVLGGALPALVYLWLGGAPPSLMRAALMLAFVGWALYRNRPLVLADSLLWALALILFWNPLTLFDLRLQLSALCIAALAWGQPAFGLLYSKFYAKGRPKRQAPQAGGSVALSGLLGRRGAAGPGAGNAQGLCPAPTLWGKAFNAPKLALDKILSKLRFAVEKGFANVFSRKTAGELGSDSAGRIVPSGGVAGGPYVSFWRFSCLRRLLGAAAMLFLSSFLIQLALAPLLVKTFGLYGLAIYLNVLWLPVLGFFVMPCAFVGLAFAALHLPAAATLFLKLASYPCGVLLDFLRWLDSASALPVLLPLRPHWLAMLGFWFLLLILPKFKSRPLAKTQLALALLLILVPSSSPLWAPALANIFGGNPSGTNTPEAAFASAPSTVLREHFRAVSPGLSLRLLDVGQGQSVLIERGRQRILVDGGGGSNPRFDVGREVVAATLTDKRLPMLDYMLASHLDLDHMGGLLFPLEHMRVAYYADNGEEAKNRQGHRLLDLLKQKGLERNVLRAGDVLDLGGGLSLEVLHPALPRHETPRNGNANSLVMRLVWQGRGVALLCGDADKNAQRQILGRIGSAGLRADNGEPAGQGQCGSLEAEILVLPHHGAASSLLPEFYAAVKPRLALASAAYGNFWHFPSPTVKNTLLNLKIPLLSSSGAGQIELFLADPKSSFRLSTARYGQLDF